MRYRVTLQTGEIHEFNSPFQEESLRKTMNLPLTAKIEVIPNPEVVTNEDQSNVG